MNSSVLTAQQYITISYDFTNSEGVLLGSSQKSGDFTFCVGQGDAILGLEKNIANHPVGSMLNFVVPAEEAYGRYNDTLVHIIPVEELPKDMSLSVGQQLTINNTKVMISEINGTHITVDSNHPLAGVDLTFHVTILEVGDAPPITATESECGCGHSCGCGKH